MIQGICALSNIPVRKEPESHSEMVNMLLFGETYSVTETKGEWLSIVSSYDGYSGWVNKKQFTPFDSIQTENNIITTFPFAKAEDEKGSHFLLPGSNWPAPLNQKLNLNGSRFVLASKPDKTSRTLIDTAKLFLNTPYLWGGRSPFGIDCSGFTQIVYKIHGARIRRDAWQQAEQGETVAFREAAQPGDLAFFDNSEGRIIHTGILIDSDNIIHASGRVRIDQLDQHGIFDADRKEYSHKLRIIKRLTTSFV